MKKVMLYNSILLGILLLLNSCSSDMSETEINSYTLLTKSLNSSIKDIAWSTERTIMYIEEEANTRRQYQSVAIGAKEISTLTKEYFDFIDSLKQRIWTNPKVIANKKKALKTTLNLGRNAVLLKTKTIQLKQNYLDTIASLWNNKGIKGTIFVDKKRKDENISKLKHNILLDSCSTNWETHTFQNLPMVAVLALLTKMQNDAKVSEAIIIDFLCAQLGRMSFYDKYDILSSAPKATIHLGETYHTIIHFGMSPSSLGYDLFINNQPVIDGNYTTTPNSIGKKELHVQFRRYNRWTGEKEVITRNFEYNVIK